jgi:hypothetical protein
VGDPLEAGEIGPYALAQVVVERDGGCGHDTTGYLRRLNAGCQREAGERALGLAESAPSATF